LIVSRCPKQKRFAKVTPSPTQPESHHEKDHRSIRLQFRRSAASCARGPLRRLSAAPHVAAAILAAALLLALIVAVLPLALVLFVVFMVFKVMVGASFIHGRRDPRFKDIN
jgi:Flp pilus assembly protein TadB